MDNKFNDYITKFNKDKEFFNSPKDACSNKWFHKINSLGIEYLPDLLKEFKENQNYYLLPALCKFYPKFKILRKDSGRTKFIISSFLEHIENNKPIG